jgi:hypothetical protein
LDQPRKAKQNAAGGPRLNQEFLTPSFGLSLLRFSLAYKRVCFSNKTDSNNIQKSSPSYYKPTFRYNQDIVLRYSQVLLLQMPLHLFV